VPIHAITPTEALAEDGRFDAIIDVRSPSEFALDHIPNAQNWPSLDDDQRVLIGTLYKQVNTFEAKKQGAALVARNIAAHIDAHLADVPRTWQPLVYCWRGGNRSGALATVLSAIGFHVHLITGGYKAFRAMVMAQTPERVTALRYRVIAGATGVGKTHVLHALSTAGEQVLDLEALACHRSSVLGLIPGTPQPSQKHFETLIWDQLRHFDPNRPVYIESESKRVGNLTVPESLITAMRASPLVLMDMAVEERVKLLMADYSFFVTDPEFFGQRLDTLIALLGHAVVDTWKAEATAGRSADVVAELLSRHYDPKYHESMARNFALFSSARTVNVNSASPADLQAAAADVQLAFEN
jgi:tRNA 2-selenouridine synthase